MAGARVLQRSFCQRSGRRELELKLTVEGETAASSTGESRGSADTRHQRPTTWDGATTQTRRGARKNLFSSTKTQTQSKKREPKGACPKNGTRKLFSHPGVPSLAKKVKTYQPSSQKQGKSAERYLVQVLGS
ncbi:hypothetical protein TcasGA2_TC002670 [Tribolium castaneum]|uniref:Uncharacterized protein n=1 Tax=Tribolium castaneum TaxID=7070 RepID=D6WEL8_TRICA|nr:hypothetical protein TcasGA2_TC002670 [Tribolium castaneum]